MKRGDIFSGGAGGIHFFATVLSSLSPKKYARLASRSYRDAGLYYLSVVLFAVLIAGLVWLPTAIMLEPMIESELAKATTLSITGIFETSEPILLPPKSPLIIIDSSAGTTDPGSAYILFTKDSIVQRTAKGTKTRLFSEYFSVDNREELARIVFFILILMVPGILVFAYVTLLVKYMIIALVASVLGYFFAKLITSGQNIHKVTKAAIYALTLPILLDIIAFSLNATRYLLPVRIGGIMTFNVLSLGVYSIYFVLGIVLSQETEVHVIQQS